MVYAEFGKYRRAKSCRRHLNLYTWLKSHLWCSFHTGIRRITLHMLIGQVEEITIVLASGEVVTCSLDKDPDLFKAALVSLGTLGVIIRLTMRASKHYNIKHTTVIISLSRFLAEYDETWKSAAYVRAWWWPYSRQVVVWRGDRTSEPPTPPGITSSTLLKPFTALSSSLQLGRRIHEGSLYALIRAPSLLPRFERILFKTQFPQKENEITEPEVAHPHKALQLDCLFSQYVDEWSVPLSSGPEAITRLDNFITSGDLSKTTGIPIPTTSSTDGQIYVHAPIEIRVSSGQGDHAFLSPAREGNPVVWIGVIMYRPYYHPTTYRKYFAAYEELMRMLGGKPHWAKQHRMNAEEEKKTWGEGMERWLSVRNRVDPDGVFVNGFVKRHLLGLLENGRDRRGVGVLDGESGRLYKRFKAVL